MWFLYLKLLWIFWKLHLFSHRRFISVNEVLWFVPPNFCYNHHSKIFTYLLIEHRYTNNTCTIRSATYYVFYAIFTMVSFYLRLGLILLNNVYFYHIVSNYTVSLLNIWHTWYILLFFLFLDELFISTYIIIYSI